MHCNPMFLMCLIPIIIHCCCRENQLTLQLMCKQHKKKDTSSGVKSLPLLRRELEHLEDYFVYKEEIDSNENCIVLTCSLSKGSDVVMGSHCYLHTILHFIDVFIEK